MVAPSIFKNLGNQILYRRPDLDRLGDALLDLWEAQESDDRWAEIEYLIRDGRFHVTYTYPDEIDSEEESLDRRDRVVQAHFGDKPIVYPPWPPDDGFDYEYSRVSRAALRPALPKGGGAKDHAAAGRRANTPKPAMIA